MKTDVMDNWGKYLRTTLQVKKASQAPSKLRLSSQVCRLLAVGEGEMTRAALMKALGLKDRVTFTNSYLSPCLRIGLVEMTQPDSPRSPTQRYRLTAKGRKIQGGVK